MPDASISPLPRPAEVKWYYLHDGVQFGPISEESLLEAARHNQIRADTLVWQQAFPKWKEAGNVPLIAVNLGLHGGASRTELSASPYRTEQSGTSSLERPIAVVTEPIAMPPAEMSFETLELCDAVSDEEAAEPVMDLEQAREILARASRPPLERTIPPAGYTSIPAPIRAQARPLITVPRLVAIAGVSLLFGVVAVVLVTREPQKLDEPPVAAAGVVSNGIDGPRTAVEAAKPKQAEPTAEARKDAAPNAENTSPREHPAEHHSELVTLKSGPLDAQLFIRKLKRGLPMYDEQCWDRLRAPIGKVTENPSVQIEMSVEPSGRIYSIESSKAPPGYRGAGLCIVGRMRGWSFPKTDRSTHVVISVPRVRD